VRHGVALAVVVGLLIALPAEARQQGETTTVTVGQTVPLKTVFDKQQTYTIVMSGVVTLTLTATGATETYDAFHIYSGNCESPGRGVYLQIKDAHGNLIDDSDAGRPPCRSDHRYEFEVNEAPAWDLDGKAVAYIPLRAAPGWTASGSFTLKIEKEEVGRRDVIFKVLAKKEARASKTDEFLADARLGGAGRIVGIYGGGSLGRGVLSLTLVWLLRDDAHLVLRPEGIWLYHRKKKGVFGHATVVKSDEPKCRKGSDVSIALLELPRSVAQVASRAPGCSALYDALLWKESASTIAVSVKEVQVKG
jgi:hypothetical protein